MAILTVVVLEVGRSSAWLAAPFAESAPFLAGAAVAAWGLKLFGSYEFKQAESLARHLARTVAAGALGGLAIFGLLSLSTPTRTLLPVASLWVLYAVSLTGLQHVGWWLLVRRWRRAGRLTPNIFVVGATPNAERLVQSALKSRDVSVLGVFDDRIGRGPDSIGGVPVLGDIDSLLEHRLLPYVDRIVITVTPSAQRRVRELIAKLRVLPNAVTMLMDEEYASAPSTLSRIAQTPLTYVSGHPHDEERAACKRMQDLAGGALALLFAAPVMAAVALAVRLDSPGPVLFRQRRQGFNNEELVILKFRSMRNEPTATTAVQQIAADDARVTRVGRFIRKTSLDELPQLFNVLRGEMSLVGPRPHAIGMMTGAVESRKLVAEYAHRHRIKPGMTGWAAIKGSRGPVDTPDDVRRRVALDVDYIERQSFWLDLYIMAMTVPCLLGDRAGVR